MPFIALVTHIFKHYNMYNSVRLAKKISVNYLPSILQVEIVFFLHKLHYTIHLFWSDECGTISCISYLYHGLKIIL